MIINNIIIGTYIIYHVSNTVLSSSSILTHLNPHSIPMIYYYSILQMRKVNMRRLSHLPRTRSYHGERLDSHIARQSGSRVML